MISVFLLEQRFLGGDGENHMNIYIITVMCLSSSYT